MDDEGVFGGSSFDFEDSADGFGVEGVAGEAVDGFGGEDDDSSFAHEARGRLDCFRCGAEHAHETAASISFRGAGMPVHHSKARAACSTSMGIPSRVWQWWWRASWRNGVRFGA